MELVSDGRIVVFGEPLLELSWPSGGIAFGGGARFGYSGDVLNCAVYLARLGQPVSCLTALGTDPFSEALLAAMQGEGVECSHVLRAPDRLPGLYAIETDSTGERRFHYWRERSAARAFFAQPGAEAALAWAAGAACLYLSGITLSLYPEERRVEILALAKRVRAGGGRVAFDPNYRPKGWASPAQARAAIEALAPHVSIALPTATDEAMLYGAETPQTIARRWLDWGAELVAVKLGAEGCLVAARDAPPVAAPVLERLQPLDTTGAGDAFNAAFLAGVFEGQRPALAAARANRLAGAVVGWPGAILPREAMPA